MPLPGARTSRSRPIPFKGSKRAILKTGSHNGGLIPPDSTVQISTATMDTKNWQGTQVTVSENHPAWRRRYAIDASWGDAGGPFFTTKKYVKTLGGGIQHLEGRIFVTPTIWNWADYMGPILPRSVELMPFPPFANSSNEELDAWGSEAIASCKPTNAVADASVFLGEMMVGGIPHLIGSRVQDFWKETTRRNLKRSSVKKGAKDASDEFLNLEFGWKPMIRDVQKFASAVVHAEEVLSQYERDSGRVVRRRFNSAPEVTTEDTVVATGVSPWINPAASALYDSATTGMGMVIRTRRTSRRKWFAGAFTYHLPTGYDSRSGMGRAALEAKKLYGLSLTPETLWNLTPWSWAVDWVSNVGDVISNLSDWAFDGLVLRYGYVMEHTLVTDTYSFVGPTGFKSKDARPAFVTLVSETKQRRKATPFGFGLNWNGFSPRQWAIVTALGITKS